MPYYNILSISSGQALEETASRSPHFFSDPDIDISYDLSIAAGQITPEIFRTPRIPFFQKYSSLLPLSPDTPVFSLGEGNTPLVKSRKIGKHLDIADLYFKCEGANPTGSFKDRGTLIEVAKAVAYGSRAITVASTGNMAASVSAYSTAAGIPCFVFVPCRTPETKLAQTLFYGGRIIEVEGAYDDAAELARKAAHEYNLYLAGDYSFRAEGQKSQAYEIAEQLEGQVPDYLFVPVGNGTNIFAVWKGLQELYHLKLISSLPKMIGVQVEGYDAVYSSWKNFSASSVTPAGATVASAIAVKKPSDKQKVLDLIARSGGELISVSESDIIPAQIELARQESLLVEPSSATVLIALKQCAQSNKIPSKSSVVCLLTGQGLKDVHSGLKHLSGNSNLCKEWSDIQTIIAKSIPNP